MLQIYESIFIKEASANEDERDRREADYKEKMKKALQKKWEPKIDAIDKKIETLYLQSSKLVKDNEINPTPESQFTAKQKSAYAKVQKIQKQIKDLKGQKNELVDWIY